MSDMQVRQCVFMCLFVHLYECLFSMNIWQAPAVSVRMCGETVRLSTGVRVYVYVIMHETAWVSSCVYDSGLDMVHFDMTPAFLNTWSMC